jgi:hypothetical protein
MRDRRTPRAQDGSLDAQGSFGTVNCFEMGEMCSDVGLFDSSYGMREMVAAFVRVNIDDELYEQEEEDNTSSELVFDEFNEMLARIFNVKVWQRMKEDERAAAPTRIELAFNAWLEAAFLPVAARAIKERRKRRGKG